MPKKEAIKRYVITNPQVLERYYLQGRSVIAVAGHYGNWEMASILGENTSFACNVVYRPLTNPTFDTFMINIRSRFNVTMVPMKNILRKLVTEKNKLTMTILLSDQTPAIAEMGAYTNFLNQSTAVYIGAEKLASLTKSVVVFIKMERLARGYYSNTFIPVSEHPELLEKFELTKLHIKLLEDIIREKPQFWLWSHKRWKIDPALVTDSEAF